MALLTDVPYRQSDSTIAGLPSPPQTAVAASDGVYLAFGEGRARVHALATNAHLSFASPTALIPFYHHVSERMLASDRLWRHLQGRRAPDTRLTDQQRKRLVQMLRAADAHADGASHRQIAESLFGQQRVRTELWHESSLRYATLRLVRDGAALIAGAYRDLLRGRRRG